jgi:putative transcriptional regulator
MVPSTILALKLAKVLGVTVEALFAIEVRPD